MHLFKRPHLLSRRCFLPHRFSLACRRTSLLLTLASVSLIATLAAKPAVAQNPGITEPTLEALVGNSAAITIVKVRSVTPGETDYKIAGAEFTTVAPLKRRWAKPGNKNPLHGPPAAFVFTDKAAASMQYYRQGHWGDDLSMPIRSMAAYLQEQKKKDAQLLLFEDFASPYSGTLHYLVPLGDEPIQLANWKSVVTADAIKKKTSELVAKYRGVDKLSLKIVSPGHFYGPLRAAGLLPPAPKKDATELPMLREVARAYIIPTDATYEAMLQAQIRFPQYLHDKQFTVTRMLWERHARELYAFDSEENRQLVAKLLKDKELPDHQRQVLEKLFATWDGKAPAPPETPKKKAKTSPP